MPLLVFVAACGQGSDDGSTASTATTAAAGDVDGTGSTVASVATSGPTAGPAGGSATSPALVGTDWKLTTVLEGESTSTPPAGVEVTLRLDGDELHVNGGCNTAGGSVAVDGNVLQVQKLVTTQMACADDVMRVEQHVMAVLQASPVFQLNGDQLQLQTGVGKGLGFSAG